jgi:hypothetical protein
MLSWRLAGRRQRWLPVRTDLSELVGQVDLPREQLDAAQLRLRLERADMAKS